jgi:hypothetical protein
MIGGSRSRRGGGGGGMVGLRGGGGPRDHASVTASPICSMAAGLTERMTK